MAQCRIVGGGGFGLAVSPQRFPRLLTTGCALHGASLSRVWPRERQQREGRSGVGLVACSPRFPRRVAAGCALHGASLSLVWPRESNQREGHPGIRVSLRETSLLPVPLREPAYKVKEASQITRPEGEKLSCGIKQGLPSLLINTSYHLKTHQKYTLSKND